MVLMEESWHTVLKPIFKHEFSEPDKSWSDSNSTISKLLMAWENFLLLSFFISWNISSSPVYLRSNKHIAVRDTDGHSSVDVPTPNPAPAFSKAYLKQNGLGL